MVQTRNGAELFGYTELEQRTTTNNQYPTESFFNLNTAGVKELHVGNAYSQATRLNSSVKAHRSSILSLASTTKSRSPGFPAINRNNR